MFTEKFSPGSRNYIALKVFEHLGVTHFPPPIGVPFPLVESSTTRRLLSHGYIIPADEEKKCLPYRPDDSRRSSSYLVQDVMNRLANAVAEEVEEEFVYGPVTAAFRKYHENRRRFKEQKPNQWQDPVIMDDGLPNDYRFCCVLCNKTFAGIKGLYGHRLRDHKK